MHMQWQKRALVTMTLAIPLLMAAAAPAQQQPQRPNIVIVWGDDVGQSNISAYSHGMMGYTTPNIDRLAKEGVMFTDYYAEQSCTAGRASFITGQSGLRTGMTKVGLPGATLGLLCAPAAIADPGNTVCEPGQIVIDGQCNTAPPVGKAPAADGSAPAAGSESHRRAGA